MNRVLPDIKTTGNTKFKEFLAKQFVCDMLFPVYEEHSVTTIFDDWHGKKMNYWSLFTNENGDILEFYAEGKYVAKSYSSKDVFQLKTPKTIKEFIDDMHRFGIQLHWSDWVVKKYQLKD